MCDTEIVVPFSTRNGNISVPRRVQTGSGSHPASYSKGTVVSFPGGATRGESLNTHITVEEQLNTHITLVEQLKIRVCTS